MAAVKRASSSSSLDIRAHLRGDYAKVCAEYRRLKLCRTAERQKCAAIARRQADVLGLELTRHRLFPSPRACGRAPRSSFLRAYVEMSLP